MNWRTDPIPDLVRAMAQAGVTVCAQGERVTLHGLEDDLPAHVADALRKRRAELAAHVRGRTFTVEAGVEI